ncbi:hypothetical protein, partial [Salinimicrobium oceani]
VANFALFLFGGQGSLAPEGMKAAVEERYVEPLLHVVTRLEGEAGTGDTKDAEEAMQLAVLKDTLKMVWQ